MVPHVFGWFTMTSVWFILFTQLENARRDIDEVSDRNIPEWDMFLTNAWRST